MLELDLLLNAFLNKGYASLDVRQSKIFEMILDYPDQVLFDLLMDKMQASDENIASMIAKIRNAAYW